MSAHVTSPADPQVIVVGALLGNGKWRYMKSEPMDYNIALNEVRSYQSTKTAVAYMRAADDPEVEGYLEVGDL